ncbi:hypothetical protein [Mucilaginibacter sp. SP1R1]|uniref:hypothetical protein n=1 Tax=Mucilaginibacter sp. SP1R1 TaxID=2723091 RepID=UPI0016124500|nr:hypothetical protein [Mucilaginibacter sp. SP1R1]MBB6148255.1 hypothetical protein [Mucilaginibacter sp. SP1R1]
MNIKFFNVALGVALTATALTASAQKKYTEGVVNFTTNMRGQQVDAKGFFRADSSAFAFTAGPASIKILTDANGKSMAILVDVPVASIKKAAIATPDEVDQALADMPTFTFAPSTETKQISGFNCKKVVATDSKTKKTYDIWITNDVEVPITGIAKYYREIGGFPVQYTSFSQGQSTEVTVKSITDTKVPAGTFGIPADYDKISLDDLKAMSGGR